MGGLSDNSGESLNLGGSLRVTIEENVAPAQFEHLRPETRGHCRAHERPFPGRL